MTGESIVAEIDAELPERVRSFRIYVTQALGEGLSEHDALARADRLLLEETKRFGTKKEQGLADEMLTRNEQLTRALRAAERREAEALAERDRLKRELAAKDVLQAESSKA